MSVTSSVFFLPQSGLQRNISHPRGTSRSVSGGAERQKGRPVPTASAGVQSAPCSHGEEAARPRFRNLRSRYLGLCCHSDLRKPADLSSVQGMPCGGRFCPCLTLWETPSITVGRALPLLYSAGDPEQHGAEGGRRSVRILKDT